ncbi:single-stranded DNA-binding protein [Paracoccus homiensis]|uniref:Single-stranded DNA-binding protein n=1 Tax=Paracoccus homiensis TaxID=364199 RepID=A0A1I0IYM1_9RHOB|nr:single-stranded DNA-binding protein [Paracoccus homiensis]SEU02498.1 single-strand binding protein [Paracoccus homiensis]
MKSISIAGNIGKDCVLRNTQNGDAVAGFSVAVEERQGQEKRTIWFDVSIWGKRGSALAQYLTKGTRVAVCGDLSTREHEGRTYLTVRADQVTLLGGGQASGQQGGAQAGGAPGRSDYDDEIPFSPEWRL